MLADPGEHGDAREQERADDGGDGDAAGELFLAMQPQTAGDKEEKERRQRHRTAVPSSRGNSVASSIEAEALSL